MQQPQAIPSQARKWEYIVVVIDKGRLLQALNDYGQQYWELVNALPVHMHAISHPGIKFADTHDDIDVTHVELYFKRPLP